MAWKNFPTKKGGNKYHNEKIFFDGQRFDSKKECNRWHELRILQRAGEISELRRQVEFVLIPFQKVRNPITGQWVTEREVKYIADFVYTDTRTNLTVVEDVKGYRDGGAYRVFVIKRKLMLQRFGIQIKEV